MQLATSQRAHPPPVPPRPSRQVVAEALKRTARPPCPTRQAPPPPNTRPWRLEDRESSAGPPSGPRLGRTVVYESAGAHQQQQQQQQHQQQQQLGHQNGHQIHTASESRECRAPHESQRPLASPRSSGDETSADRAATANGGNNNSVGNTANAVAEKTETRGSSSSGVGGSTRATSERSEAENQRERPNSLLLPQQQQQQPQQQQQQQQSRRSGGGSDQRCDRENSATQLSATDVEIAGRTVGLCYKSDENAAAGREEAVLRPVATCQPERRRDDGICEKEKTRNFDGTASRNSPEFSKITEQQEQEDKKPTTSSTSLATSENIGRLVEGIERRRDDNNGNNGNADDARVERRSRSFGEKKADSSGETAIGTRSTSSAVATPTKIAASGVVNNEATAKVVEPIGLAIENDDVVVSGAAATAVLASGISNNGSSAATAVSSDDCATVVIVDEPERKIAFTEDNDNNIHHQDWLEAGIRYSSTKITLPGDDPVDRADEFADYDGERRGHVRYDYSSICERIAMSSLQGLPPLPRSLSGFNLSEGRREATEPPPPPARSSSKTQKNVKSTQPSSSRPSPPGRQLTTLDTQLAILRKEMFGLRQLDLSLLSQLWSLNESIQEFRQLLQEQEDRAPSPSPSSEEGDDNSYGGHPPPPPRRPAPLLHHHRPPRPPRPLRPPASDDSPSSEEYGAV